MLIHEYSNQASKTDSFQADGRSVAVRRYGLFGQVGSLLEIVKKQSREAQLVRQREQLTEEIGDILWYICAISRQFNIALEEIIHDATISMGITTNEKIVTFEQLDQYTAKEMGQENLDTLLHSLGSKAGELLAAGPHENCQRAELANIVKALIETAQFFKLSLNEVAQYNISKTKARWPGSDRIYGNRLDAGAKPFEQFPVKLEFNFIERQHEDKQFVYPQVNGINIGSRLTDNHREPDGYRFHDVFHIAYAVHLGWSPVLRALLKLKRKHQPEVDENQDGARAIIIEEGIATWIFNHASRKENQYYADVEIGQLPYRLLKQVSLMVDGYEVDVRPLWQWEIAILDGFRIFRNLLHSGGGRIVAHFDEHRFEFFPTKEEDK